ncbi:MAG: HU family DNA-binding protein [Fimbriimonadaceae bacterium]|nr:HU family DNA-binding protein [Fimbriimonadaceae bacterium]
MAADSVSKKDLVSAVAKSANLSQAQTAAVVDALLDEIVSALKAGKKVRLIGFGTFEVRERAERKGVNPRTQKPMNIPASKSPAFKPGKELKDAI